MEIKYVRCLTNSISRFVLLVSCQKSKAIPNQNDFGSMAVIMKHLKSVLDEVIDDKLALDQVLLKECELLDVTVNEARELLEKWSQKKSKILFFLQSEPLLTKTKKFSLEICRILCKLLQMSPSTSSMASVQHCMRELQSWGPEMLSKHIEQALRGNSDEKNHHDEYLPEIIELLGLTSKQELLKEFIAVEKERLKTQTCKSMEAINLLDRALDLLSLIRDFILKNGFFDQNGLAIPPFFRCPLSFELMLDPVIVASGQTFERASIQKWLDQGLNVCPKTRQYLSHKNLIANYTIKALIANWCEENNIKLPSASDTSCAVSVSSRPDHAMSQDIIRGDSSCLVHSSKSISESSIEAGGLCARQKVEEASGRAMEDSSKCQLRGPKRSDPSSPEHSDTHSRTQSASSAISSNDFLPMMTSEVSTSSNKNEELGLNSGEITSERVSLFVNNSLTQCDSLTSKSSCGMADDWKKEYPRTLSGPTSDLRCDELSKYSHVRKLVEDLGSQSNEIQTAAAAELRLLSKHDMENRNIIQKCGAIQPLISLMYSDVKMTQEHAVTTLLNLSISEANKAKIAEAGALEPFMYVLKSGNDAAKENSAAALASLSVLEEFKVKIGRSDAVKLLVDLLSSGTIRGKKDAATALFNLSICHENKARIVKAGAVKYLVDLLDPALGMVDKALALLANLSTINEGRLFIAREEGIPLIVEIPVSSISTINGIPSSRLFIAREEGIPLIVEILETGSPRGKENAASILLQLCLNSTKLCNMVLQEGAVPPLVALSQCGTIRAREKATQLLAHFRSQRDGAVGKKSS